MTARSIDTTIQVSREKLIDFLSAVPLFDGLNGNREALAAVASCLKFVTFDDGVDLMTVGSIDTQAIFLLKGKVAVYKFTSAGDRFLVSRVDDGESPYFGAGALLEDRPRTASVTAEGLCECLALERKDFQNLCRQHPEWGLPIVMKMSLVLSKRLRKMTSDYFFLYNAYIAEVQG